jgi:hypothetical protein
MVRLKPLPQSPDFKDVRGQAGKFLRTHPSEDLEAALKALEIAPGSLEEVVERYE